MKIAIVGIGYVGLVSAACFAELGAEVYCVDTDITRVNSLKQGHIPIYEPGLEAMVARGLKGGRLHFHADLGEVINLVAIAFIAVGTPQAEDGSADLSAVLSVAHQIGQSLNNYCLIVTKSTVPVGTSERVRSAIYEELAKRGLNNLHFDVASNPEFLKEGNAIEDFMRPDRVIVGVDSDEARELMTRLYRPILLSKFRVLFMDIASAEMCKYAANAMLATRISFMNEIAALCEELGADVNMVRRGMGSDERIGSKFLYAGCGYGGSCFPKDVRALMHTGRTNGVRMQILEAVEAVNERQKHILYDKLHKYYPTGLKGKNIAVWGVSFKPGTDDIREAPALCLIDSLLSDGAKVSLYDPVALSQAQRVYGSRVRYATDVYDCARDADAILHVTEWKEFRMPSWSHLAQLVRTPLLIDGRNVFDDSPKKEGFKLILIGVPNVES